MFTLPKSESINSWLTSNGFSLLSAPAVSPDYCLDWKHWSATLAGDLSSADRDERLRVYEHALDLSTGKLLLAENRGSGDCCWLISEDLDEKYAAFVNEALTFEDAIDVQGILVKKALPCTWSILVNVIKNLLLEGCPTTQSADGTYDARLCVFPSALPPLDTRSLGIGARMTALHWPGALWTLKHLPGIALTGNQNSVPRELVYSTEAMLAGKLQRIRFPFLGADVPEGHQGQSIEGMSHGAVLECFKRGAFRHGHPWGFNADHQPIGGRFDAIENDLVVGSLLASYITFDVSPELLSKSQTDSRTEIPSGILREIFELIEDRTFVQSVEALEAAIRRWWSSLAKLKQRDELYTAVRKQFFHTEQAQRYHRELSIDELPGLTSPAEITALLAACKYIGVWPLHYIAPALGFQKNLPFEDNKVLSERLGDLYRAASQFGVSIGFHSGSGKSFENYRTCGESTNRCLEVKTSGRYTYELGRALFSSPHSSDNSLFTEWYRFTVSLASAAAFAEVESEREVARRYILDSVRVVNEQVSADELFASPNSLSSAMALLSPHPDHPVWFEYNFLFVLAADAEAHADALGDHTAKGYRQRSRFYTGISDDAKLRFAVNIAKYICFLAESTQIVEDETLIAKAKERLDSYESYEEFLRDM